MSRLGDLLSGLPPAVRWPVYGAAGLVVALAVAGGVWTYLGRREAAAEAAFADGMAAYRQALAGRDDAAVGPSVATLERFLSLHGGSRLAPEAWYLSGNLEYQRRAFDAAVAAYDRAIGRGGGAVDRLSRLGRAYAVEGKGDLPAALEAYRLTLRPEARDFAHEEALLGLARVQEGLQQPKEAIEAYRRFLQEAPSSSRAGDARARLAILGVSG